MLTVWKQITSWVNEEDSSILNGNVVFEYKAEESEIFSSTVPINVGNYKYRVKTNALSSSNYIFKSEEADYIIDKKPLRITIGNATAEYGSDFSKLDISVTYGGNVYRYNYGGYIGGFDIYGEEGWEEIDANFAYNDEVNLSSKLEELKEFKFGSFTNDIFKPYDPTSSHLITFIFFAIDRATTGLNLTNFLDNYIILTNGGCLDITKKEIVNDDSTANWIINEESLNTIYDENDVCWKATSVVKTETFDISFISNFNDVLSIAYSYKKILTDGESQDVELISGEGTFEITATLTLIDTIHYTLNESQKTVKLILTVSAI